MMNMKHDKIEVLAPAGSPKVARAVVGAGADAVYFAGNAFGARAYAPNFTRQEAAEMLDFVHLHRKKAYLAVNTLLKNPEMERQLYDDLRFYYEAGVDAVLVQDFGVLIMLRNYFPDLPIHASTQMNITTRFGAEFLAKYGIQRIVAARELSLAEIRTLCGTSAEIEVFVHGALCVCYSGQCLMSSFLGGRSGNRGRCAQPCRLPYDVLDWRGKKLATPGNYMLSPKDLCGVAELPALIEAGVHSLKIEGRMKQAAYAATVTSVYRKYVDLYWEQGKEHFAVSDEDMELLLASGSRNGFTNAYFFVHNTPEMMSFLDSSHGKKSAKGNGRKQNEKYAFGRNGGRTVEKDFLSEDETELAGVGEIFDEKIAIAGQFTAKIGEPLSLTVCCVQKENGSLSVGILHTNGVSSKRSKELFSEIEPTQKLATMEEPTVISEEQINDVIEPTVFSDEKIIDTIDSATFIDKKTFGQEKEILVTVVGAVCEQAQKQPVSEADIREKLNKTGNSPFRFTSLAVEMDTDAFIPLKEINRLRREALDELYQKLVAPFHRTTDTIADFQKSPIATDFHELSVTANLPITKTETEPQRIVRVTNQEQLQIAEKSACVDMIVLSVSLYESIGSKNKTLDSVISEKTSNGAANRKSNRQNTTVGQTETHSAKTGDTAVMASSTTQPAGKRYIIEIPTIFRQETAKQYEQFIQKHRNAEYEVSSYDALGFLQEMDIPMSQIHAGYRLYMLSDRTREAFRNIGIAHGSIPLELSKKELMHRNNRHDKMLIYGRVPLMYTANCVAKNIGKCARSQNKASTAKQPQNAHNTKKDGERTPLSNLAVPHYFLQDRKGKAFPVTCDCTTCTNIIYNTVPTDLIDKYKNIVALQPEAIEIAFTTESGAEAEAILKRLQKAIEGKNESTPPNYEFTRGHFAKSIE